MSIIIPIYNVAPYIEMCIRSVIEQTTTESIECILVDDCGTDNSVEIAENLLANYQGNIQFHLVHHEHNRGLSAARNTGVEKSCGEWLYFLDSDDSIIPVCIELMLDKANKYPQSEIVFAGANATAKNFLWMDNSKKNLPEYSEDPNWLQLSMLKRLYLGMAAWNKLISRHFFYDNKLFFIEGLILEDEVWNMQVARCLKSASFLTINTYNYTCREDSILSLYKDESRWKPLMKIWLEMAKHIEGNNRDMQAKAVCSYMLAFTIRGFPSSFRTYLFKIYSILAKKSMSKLSVFLLFQGILAIAYPKKYNNYKICSRLKLY